MACILFSGAFGAAAFGDDHIRREKLEHAGLVACAQGRRVGVDDGFGIVRIGAFCIGGVCCLIDFSRRRVIGGVRMRFVCSVVVAAFSLAAVIVAVVMRLLQHTFCAGFAMSLARRVFMIMAFAGHGRHAFDAKTVTVNDLAAPPCGC